MSKAFETGAESCPEWGDKRRSVLLEAVEQFQRRPVRILQSNQPAHSPVPRIIVCLVTYGVTSVSKSIGHFAELSLAADLPAKCLHVVFVRAANIQTVRLVIHSQLELIGVLESTLKTKKSAGEVLPRIEIRRRYHHISQPYHTRHMLTSLVTLNY
jgi:hypothetical protein